MQRERKQIPTYMGGGGGEIKWIYKVRRYAKKKGGGGLAKIQFSWRQNTVAC